MDTIGKNATVTDKRNRPRRWQSLLVIAACLAVAGMLSWFQVSRESRASDLLLEIAGVSVESSDRVQPWKPRHIGNSVEVNLLTLQRPQLFVDSPSPPAQAAPA